MTRPTATPPRLRAALAGPALALLLVLAGCAGPTSAPSPDTRTAPADGTSPSGSAGSPGSTGSPTERGGTPQANEVVAGLTSPWGLAPLADGRLLVSERDTRLVRLVDGNQVSTVGEIGEAVPQGEGGLLGLALSPDETTLYAYYTAAQDNRVVAMPWDGVDLGPGAPILTGIPKGGRHNGGRIVVGPDATLWIGTGDAGDSSLARDLGSLGGKILHVTATGEVPADNPFDSPVWSYGHRNVQGLAFDPQGRLWASEFGDNRFDELNLITRGADYGWPEVEGSGGGDGLTDPEVVWPTEDASPSGLAWWQGRLWMASLRGERLWEIPVDGDQVGEPVARFTGDFGRLRSVVVAPDGASLLLSASDTDGRGDADDRGDELLRVTLT